MDRANTLVFAVLPRHSEAGPHIRTGAVRELSRSDGSPDRFDGEQVWQASLRRRPNLAAVFCGHTVGAQGAYRVDAGDNGNAVMTSFQNWQMVD